MWLDEDCQEADVAREETAKDWTLRKAEDKQRKKIPVGKVHMHIPRIEYSCLLSVISNSIELKIVGMSPVIPRYKVGSGK